MIRIGRFTAALCLTVLGVVLLLDHSGAMDALRFVRTWWPAALVALGIELIVKQSLQRQAGTRLRFSFGAMFGAVILGGFVLIAAKSDELRLGELQNWPLDWGWSFYNGNQAKYTFDKGAIVIPMPNTSRKVSIQDLNGHVTLTEGPVTGMEVKAVLYIDAEDQAQAEMLAEASGVRVEEGETLIITAQGESFGPANLRKPRMDLTVTFPKGKVPSELEVNVGNGAVKLDRLPNAVQLAVDVKNGEITGTQIGGMFRAKLLNGDIRMDELLGNADLDVVNGDVKVQNAASALHVKTVHGDIEVRSAAVGGDWKMNSTIGDVTLAWPEEAGVRVSAKSSFAGVNTSWPLQLTEHEAFGTLGDGTWRITAETHSDILLDKFLR